jgi:hypothetical protein
MGAPLPLPFSLHIHFHGHFFTASTAAVIFCTATAS